jgi:uncharacterized protein YqjF (DUF2071 family)
VDVRIAALDGVDAAVRRLPGCRDAALQGATLEVTGHRPWPLPRAPWLMAQTWLDLLFAHWRLPPAALSRVLPPGVEPDRFDGSAWIGVTPFEVSGLRLHGTPPVPLLSRFAETNVRTYVTVDGRPGIWFLSLDAASRLAVFAARRAYRLPYFHAEMTIARERETVRYTSRRRSADGEPAELAIAYRATGPRFTAAPGTLDHFLTERYCLYTLDREGRLLRAQIHHPPWPLQPAAAEIARITMARPYGIGLDEAPLLHLAGRQDVLIWPLEPAGRGLTA